MKRTTIRENDYSVKRQKVKNDFYWKTTIILLETAPTMYKYYSNTKKLHQNNKSTLKEKRKLLKKKWNHKKTATISINTTKGHALEKRQESQKVTS